MQQKNQENKDPQSQSGQNGGNGVSNDKQNILGPKNSAPNVQSTYSQNIAQTSASNITSAINSISALNSNSTTTTQQSTSNYSSNQQRAPYINQNSPYDMYITNYSSSKSPTNAGNTKQNIFKLPEEKERPESSYSSTNDKKKATNMVTSTTTSSNNNNLMGANSPDSNLSNKKFVSSNQTPSTNKLLNMNYQVGVNRSPIPETSNNTNSNSSSNLNKGLSSNSNKYSFLKDGNSNRQAGGFKINKDVNNM